jgi:hypothetical protein
MLSHREGFIYPNFGIYLAIIGNKSVFALSPVLGRCAGEEKECCKPRQTILVLPLRFDCHKFPVQCPVLLGHAREESFLP